MSDEAVQSTKDIYTMTTNTSKIDFGIKSQIADIQTALPVTVQAVEGGGVGIVGYVDVLPLVTMVSGKGEAVNPVTLYHLPYMRVQGGKAALIIDPEPGDIGLAVFCQRDTSNVTPGTTEPQQPGSRRMHSQSDGWYIGGFLNQLPTVYLQLKDNKAVLHAPGGVTIDGNVTVNGDVTADGISLKSHVHGGVESGGSTTGAPQ